MTAPSGQGGRPGVGTLAWSRVTAGVVSPRDRVSLVRLAIAMGLLDVPPYLLARCGLLGDRGVDIDYEVLSSRPRSGTAAREALAALHELAPPMLVNHSLRTYWYSALIGQAGGAWFDDELLFVAALAHDIGMLLPAGQVDVAHGLRGAPCFAVRGAAWAMEIAERAQWPGSRVASLGEAVTLNLNGRVGPRQGIEAHLMMRGVLADVTGLHRWRISRSNQQALYRDLPLLNQRAELPAMFRAEADLHPECRGYFALHRLGFGVLMHQAPSL